MSGSDGFVAWALFRDSWATSSDGTPPLPLRAQVLDLAPLSDFEAFVLLNPNLEWAVQFFVLVDDERPLLQFKVCMAIVKSLPGFPDATPLWGPKPPPPDGRRSAADGGDADWPAWPARVGPPSPAALELEDGDMGQEDGQQQRSSSEEDEAVASSPSDEDEVSALSDPYGSDLSDMLADVMSDKEGVEDGEAVAIPRADRTAESSDDGGEVEGLWQATTERASTTPPSASSGPLRAASSSATAYSRRATADTSMVLPNGGVISFYRSTGNFQATCACDRHTPANSCRLTRTHKPSQAMSRKGQGRPLGLMAAWLLSCETFGSSSEHKDAWGLNFAKDRNRRRDGRAALKACPGYAALAAHERPSGAGSDSEPEDIP